MGLATGKLQSAIDETDCKYTYQDIAHVATNRARYSSHKGKRDSTVLAQMICFTSRP